VTTHGTRASYRSGCRCTPCRAAEASYQRTLRREKARGQVHEGALVPAARTLREVRHLISEALTKASIAKALGLKRPRLELHTGRGAKVTVRTARRIHALYQRWTT
jgi:hypothetical protein